MRIEIKSFNELSNNELYEIFKLRLEVFVVEQKCPYQDIDLYDKISYHISIYDKNELVGYCRLLPGNTKFIQPSIGRVIAKYRRKGIGSILLDEAIKLAKEKFKEDILKVEAQCYAVPFYENKGFKTNGEPFLEDGIWHIEMFLDL